MEQVIINTQQEKKGAENWSDGGPDCMVCEGHKDIVFNMLPQETKVKTASFSGLYKVYIRDGLIVSLYKVYIKLSPPVYINFIYLNKDSKGSKQPSHFLYKVYIRNLIFHSCLYKVYIISSSSSSSSSSEFIYLNKLYINSRVSTGNGGCE